MIYIRDSPENKLEIDIFKTLIKMFPTELRISSPSARFYLKSVLYTFAYKMICYVCAYIEKLISIN